MSSLEIASGVIGFIETTITLLGRLRRANERQKELSQVLTDHTRELEKMKAVLQLVRDEDALQTAAVTSELLDMEEASKKLVRLLQELSKSRGPAQQFVRQLVHGSEDERSLAKIMEDLGRFQRNLSLRIQVAHVGLTRALGEKMVLEVEVVRRIDELLQQIFGKGRGLQITGFIQSRTPQDDGTIPLTKGDIASFQNDTASAAEDANILEGTRIVVNNLTEDQAFQINGPVGQKGWMEVSHLEIKNNTAKGESTQVNHGISIEALESLLEQRSATTRGK